MPQQVECPPVLEQSSNQFFPQYSSLYGRHIDGIHRSIYNNPNTYWCGHKEEVDIRSLSSSIFDHGFIETRPGIRNIK
jgi:hypothetical protein